MSITEKNLCLFVYFIFIRVASGNKKSFKKEYADQEEILYYQYLNQKLFNH